VGPHLVGASTRRAGWRWIALAASALAWVLALLGLAVTATRWVDLAWAPIVLIQSLSPLAAPLCLVSLGGVVLRGRLAGRMTLGGVCVLVLVVHAVIWAPWLTDESPAAGRRLTLMTVNLFRGHADTEAIARQVRSHGVDVLVLTEVYGSATSELRADGINGELPYAVPDVPVPGSTVIRSRLTLTPVSSPPDVGATASRNPAATLRFGRTIAFRGVHPPPPTPDRVGQWRSTLAELTTWSQRTRGPLIMAGDFNASVDHPSMRQLLASGLRDAHEVAGAGRPRTWPNGRAVPAFVHLDHVLVRGIDVQSAQEVRLPGTDHDAIIVDLVVPPAR
jgi:endonuclease/exonuclease/phosphatase (EEP) superfamily protein YafD